VLLYEQNLENTSQPTGTNERQETSSSTPTPTTSSSTPAPTPTTSSSTPAPTPTTSSSTPTTVHREGSTVRGVHRVGGYNVNSPRITLKYMGLSAGLFNPYLGSLTDEVMIEQQHCGGNPLVVYRDRIRPGSKSGL